MVTTAFGSLTDDQKCENEEQRNLRLERTHLHPSTSSSTLRLCEIDQLHHESNIISKPHWEIELMLMLSGGISSPTLAITRKWISGYMNFAKISIMVWILVKIFYICRLSHDGAISPLESNGLIKSKAETIISLDYVCLVAFTTISHLMSRKRPSSFSTMYVQRLPSLFRPHNTHACNCRAPTHQWRPHTRRQMDTPKAVVLVRWDIWEWEWRRGERWGWEWRWSRCFQYDIIDA